MSTDPRVGEAAQYVEPQVLEQLVSMRSSIDNIDAALIHLLAERFKATQRVGVLKAQHQLPPADPSREKNQIQRLKRLAEDAQLNPDFAEKFLNFIIEEVIRHHQAISQSTLNSSSGRGPTPTDQNQNPTVASASDDSGQQRADREGSEQQAARSSAGAEAGRGGHQL